MIKRFNLDNNSFYQPLFIFYFYFEVNDRSVKRYGGKYFVVSKNRFEVIPAATNRLLQLSDRAWCEQEGCVWYIKHRKDPTTEVDLKEFMWIKLKAETIHGP